MSEMYYARHGNMQSAWTNHNVGCGAGELCGKMRLWWRILNVYLLEEGAQHFCRTHIAETLEASDERLL